MMRQENAYVCAVRETEAILRDDSSTDSHAVHGRIGRPLDRNGIEANSSEELHRAARTRWMRTLSLTCFDIYLQSDEIFGPALDRIIECAGVDTDDLAVS
jgi:hypothetical protein